ncbi:response regulator receiver protein [Alkalidesulfovibrio alkalitolerans DSM 16529]|uniref:Response regulator receiver protein n=1 Tax=Alkalidesulfovibrio alkalitolerans DSM 16529 TaxID=1121439 RepID=S7T7M1_9BACT|nr:response regulator [Alkalidesulfovibrio alkalitolerans]EPR33122.1 response regulator receiver protein [Alkalidesulfovibrio alkalitolerans DSM 16529]
MNQTMPNILIVDDEERFRITLGKRLKEAGFPVETVGGGQEALDHLTQHAVDVVILDIKMPGLNGIEVLAEIRRRHIGAEVLLLTGHAEVASAVDGMRLGAHDYLMKPYEFQGLQAKIHDAYKVKLNREERLRKAEARAQLDKLEKSIRF